MLNQNFPVIYKNSFFMVDPICLSNVSRKFRNLIQPFLNQPNDLGKMNLHINYQKFTERNVANFLKLCQNLPTDCQNSEVEEICEIAKMFQADNIYSTGLNFVRNNIDPNFSVPDQEFDESKGISFLVLSAETKKVHHVSDFNSLEFDDENSHKVNNNNFGQNNSNQISNNSFNSQSNNNPYSQNENTRYTQYTLNQNNQYVYSQTQLNQGDARGIDPSSSCQINLNSSGKNSTTNISKENNNSSKKDVKEPNKQQIHSVIYEIKVDPQFMKLPIIHFIADGQVVLTAKHKGNTIVIGKGSNVHLKKDRSNHVAKISMQNGINTVSCEGQEFHITFVYFSGPGTFSVAADFMHKGKCIHWKPKEPRHNKATNTYSLSLHGEYHHFPLKSTKNTVLINDLDESCLIIRKVAEEEYEAECHPDVSQIIIFAFALSQIIGPNEAYSTIMRM